MRKRKRKENERKKIRKERKNERKKALWVTCKLSSGFSAAASKIHKNPPEF